MTKQDLQELRQDIINFQIENIEAKIDMYKEYLSTLFYIMFLKGFKVNFIQELYSIKEEYMQILSEENKLFREILKKASKKDLDAIDNLIIKINELNETTIEYYYSLLSDIENDAERENRTEYKRIRRSFKTIIESYDFRKEVVGLTISLEDIKLFLDYEESFWEYIKPYIKTINEPYTEYDTKMCLYGIWYELDSSNEIKKLKICIPQIIDLKTSQIAIHEIVHAHDIYSKKILSKEEYEKRAQKEEIRFQEEYIPKKNKRLFK